MVRVRTVELASSFDTRWSSDYMEGDLLLVGPRGEILTPVPPLLAVPAGPGSEYHRVINLAQTSAAWVPRRI